MSTTSLPENQSEPGITLPPELPSPADLPPVENLPDGADMLADPIALAALLTGSEDMRAVGHAMVEAGAAPQDVLAAMERTEGYARLLVDLFLAVDSVLRGVPDARSGLHAVNARLAQLEQGRG